MVASTRGKAPGIDGWTADHWLRMPSHFFDVFVDLWNRALAVGKIPSQWKAIRTVMIPKSDGGQRPLSIAPLAWRIGTSSIIKSLGRWIDRWAPKELVGGLPGRSADLIHQEVSHGIRSSMNGDPLVLVKQDLKKAFDSIDPYLSLIHI